MPTVTARCDELLGRTRFTRHPYGCPWCGRTIRVRAGRLVRHNDVDPRETRLIGGRPRTCQGSCRTPGSWVPLVVDVVPAGGVL